MQKQTWGFSNLADFNLDSQDLEQWPHGKCVISVGCLDHTEEGYFAPVDVGYISKVIIDECVRDTKAALGGTTNIDSIVKGFYVVVGGRSPRTGITATARRAL